MIFTVRCVIGTKVLKSFFWDDNRRRIAGIAGCGFYDEASNPLTGSKGKPPDFGKNGCCFSSLKKRIESKIREEGCYGLSPDFYSLPFFHL
jgi:hypothetical protein